MYLHLVSYLTRKMRSDVIGIWSWKLNWEMGILEENSMTTNFNIVPNFVELDNSICMKY